MSTIVFKMIPVMPSFVLILWNPSSNKNLCTSFKNFPFQHKQIVSRESIIWRVYVSHTPIFLRMFFLKDFIQDFFIFTKIWLLLMLRVLTISLKWFSLNPTPSGSVAIRLLEYAYLGYFYTVAFCTFLFI